ncbi:MAG TPA: helix-turn-helix transcriptional regulator [Candidatus Dormibacteraeota bacterium]
MADHPSEQLPIGQRIMRYRVRAGMSRAQLSGLIGKSPSWLYKVERGLLTPDRLSVLSELAAVLRVDISELAGAPVHPALVPPPPANVAAPDGAAPPAPEPPAPPPAPVVVLAAVEDAAPPVPEPPPPPWPATWPWERRRAVVAVLAAAVAVVLCVLLRGAISPHGGGDDPRARAAPPMTVFPASPQGPPGPAAAGAPEPVADSSPVVAALPPATGPQPPPPGSTAAHPPGGAPGAARSQGAAARTSTAAAAPPGPASPSPSTRDLAAWWPWAAAASSGACDGSQSGGCSQGSGQAGRCSNAAYDGDTGAVPDAASWHLTVQVGSGGTLCAHWNNPGIEGTLTGPDGRSRVVHGDTWMVLSAGPGRYTLQLRRVDPSRPDHALLQLFV